MIDKRIIDSVHVVFPAFDGEITPETTAAEVPGWDSFGHVELIFELEDRFGMRIDPMRTLTCRNIGELQEVLEKQAAKT